MSSSYQPSPEFEELLDAMCDGRMSAQQSRRLEEIVIGSDDDCWHYLRHIHLHGTLHWNIAYATMQPTFAPEAEGTNLPSPFGRGAVENLPSPFGRGAGGEGGEVDVGSQEPVPSTPYSVLRTPYSSLSSFLPTTPLGSVAFSYAMSAVLVCIGLFIFSLMSASSPHNAIVINKSPTSQNPTQPNTPAPEPKIVSIARITGMVDCTWENTYDVPFHDRVVLGTKYMLKSGLLEITYYSGAKVILQGPCTYEVESTAGGYLSLGKLTARLETAKPQAAKQPSLPPSPLFSVRTPTAVVTDLGTEFGVEVAPDKQTLVYVIQGAVVAARDARTGGTPFRERLTASHTIYIPSLSAVPRIDLPEHVQQMKSRGVFADRRELRQIQAARLAQCVSNPIALVATAYHRVWGKDGKLLAEDNRSLAFQVATDGIFGRGEKGEGPRSSFDTGAGDGGRRTGAIVASEKAEGGRRKVEETAKPQSPRPKSNIQHPASPAPTAFVGLRYDRLVRFDRIKVFLGRQEMDGGCWAEMPRVFILKNPVDTRATSPEDDPANWREVSGNVLYGKLDAKPGVNPGMVLEFALTASPVEQRTGYGWAVGGVPGNGSAKYVSITELRAYMTPEGK